MHSHHRNAAPRTSPPCTTYYGSLDSVQGLTTFANAQWYELTTHALYRVREVVVANMDAHLAQSPRPVQRKLHDVKQLLEAPFANLSIGYPLCWRGGGSTAVARVDFILGCVIHGPPRAHAPGAHRPSCWRELAGPVHLFGCCRPRAFVPCTAHTPGRHTRAHSCPDSAHRRRHGTVLQVLRRGECATAAPSDQFFKKKTWGKEKMTFPLPSIQP
ncbi:hypothetical protein JG688_00016622 [Phytophthora aleatoria]|uniref:Uncharacterized protein n=1 Tax=Phytophthora aleatoria TaxID=2496075 RepID=A0A8J5LYX7_9STRA|nr:hypothetical protein JG688_00016622 [Phytophthora aleatoria]